MQVIQVLDIVLVTGVLYPVYVISDELLMMDHLQLLLTAHPTPQATNWVLTEITKERQIL